MIPNRGRRFCFAFRRRATEKHQTRSENSFKFLPGFFQTEFVERLWDSIYIQPEAVPRIMAEKDGKNILDFRVF
jgi:hypothetical protein